MKNEKLIKEVLFYEKKRISSIVSNSDHDTALEVIQRNYRIYLEALKSLKVSRKSSVVKISWLVTILYYRKVLKDFGLPFGASTV